MTKIEKTALERLLSECFAGGERRRRELRLSREQARQVERLCPDSQVRAMGGSWYEISFQGVRDYGS